MARIALSGPSGIGLFAEVDDEDFYLATRYRWYVLKVKGSKTLYARTKKNGRNIFLHRLVTDAGPGEEIDHIDGNGLNNAKSNLRLVTRSQNIKSARSMLGRYTNPTEAELDAELEAFEDRQRTAAEQTR